MSSGTINSKSVKTEHLQEQEKCSLDVYCNIIFTPFSLCEAQLDLINQTKRPYNHISEGEVSYIGDIHCQRVVFNNCVQPTGNVIEGLHTIVVDCSNISTELYLDESLVKPKISFAISSLQNLLIKYFGHQVTLHIGVISFTLTEDVAKCFSYNLFPDNRLLPEDIGLLNQLDRSLGYHLNVFSNSQINLDFVINYDTFPVIFSDTIDLTEEDDNEHDELPIKSEKKIDPGTSIEKSHTNTEEVIYNNQINSDNDDINLSDGSTLLLKGEVSETVFNIDNLFLLSPALVPLAITYKTTAQFVDYIQTEGGKIWWKGVSTKIHLASEVIRDNANKLSGWLFDAAIGGYVATAVTFIASGGAATPASAVLATGSSLILFGSGVAATISSIATITDSFIYALDYISDPIENEAARDKALTGILKEGRNFVISRIGGSVGKKIDAKLIKGKPKTPKKEQLKRQEKLREEDIRNLDKTERDLVELKSKKNNKKTKKKGKNYTTMRKELLKFKKKLNKIIKIRDKKIEDLSKEILLDNISGQSSSTYEDIFKNLTVGTLNKFDSNTSDNQEE